MQETAHIDGGFKGWKEAGGPGGKPAMPVTKGIKALVEEAYAQVETWTVEDAIANFERKNRLKIG